MSQRISRVNELLQREISQQLHQYYRSAAVKITISTVETSSDLRRARIYYSVIGNNKDIADAEQLFRRITGDLQRRVGKLIVLKYFPKFEFIYDASFKRGAELNELLDQLGEEEIR
jgi:ribosome-binding factor A